MCCQHILSDIDFYRLVSNLQTGLAKTEFYYARLWREENPGKEDPHFLHLLLSPTYDINVSISCYVLKHEILNVKKSAVNRYHCKTMKILVDRYDNGLLLKKNDFSKIIWWINLYIIWFINFFIHSLIFLYVSFYLCVIIYLFYSCIMVMYSFLFIYLSFFFNSST